MAITINRPFINLWCIEYLSFSFLIKQDLRDILARQLVPKGYLIRLWLSILGKTAIP